MNFTRRLAAVSCSVLAAALLNACSSSTSSAPDRADESVPTTVAVGEALTVAEATTLSRLLSQNLQLGGADVKARVPYGVTSYIELDGAVDWKQHVGKVEVRVIRDDGSLVDTQTVFWADVYDPTKALILTTVKGLEAEVAKTGRPGVKYVLRAYAERSPLDRVLRYLDGLATAQAENPLLLRQDGKARSFGEATIDIAGAPTKTLQLGYGQSRYWADTSNGRLVQASAPLAGLDEPTVFSLTNHRVVKVEFPPESEVVRVTDIPQIYEQLTTPKK
jgi:hypothetical protein